MGPVTVSVFRRTGFNGLVDFTVGGFIALREISSADEFVVTRRSWEINGGDAMSFPFGRDGSEVFVVEALVVRRDASVDDSNDEVRAKVGFFKETRIVSFFEAEKLRGASGVEVAELVRDERENMGVRLEGLDLRR